MTTALPPPIETNEELEEQRVLVISTAHITAQDSRYLEKGRFPITVASDTYGYYVWTYGSAMSKAPEGVYEELNARGFSDRLFQLLRFANSRGFHYLRIDQDGPVYERFPTFNW